MIRCDPLLPLHKELRLQHLLHRIPPEWERWSPASRLRIDYREVLGRVVQQRLRAVPGIGFDVAAGSFAGVHGLIRCDLVPSDRGMSLDRD